MWEHEYGLDTAAAPDTLWRYWSDLTTWPQWNNGIEKIETDGPFTIGTTFTMTPPDGDPITLRPVEIVPGELFTDEMDAGDFTVRTVHRLEHATAGMTRVTYRTEITGSAADQIGSRLGPAITADFPKVSPRWCTWPKVPTVRSASGDDPRSGGRMTRPDLTGTLCAR